MRYGDSLQDTILETVFFFIQKEKSRDLVEKDHQTIVRDCFLDFVTFI